MMVLRREYGTRSLPTGGRTERTAVGERVQHPVSCPPVSRRRTDRGRTHRAPRTGPRTGGLTAGSERSSITRVKERGGARSVDFRPHGTRDQFRLSSTEPPIRRRGRRSTSPPTIRVPEAYHRGAALDPIRHGRRNDGSRAVRRHHRSIDSDAGIRGESVTSG